MTTKSTNLLYDYLFHFNSYTKEWNAFRREDKEKYFNGELMKHGVLKSPSFNGLLKELKKQKQIKE